MPDLSKSPTQRTFRLKSEWLKLLGQERLWWCVCLAVGLAFAWKSRGYMNPDGVSYLDMASGVLNGHPSALINGYWSPGYPAILSVGLWIFRPSPTQEFALVHFLNFLIFAAALSAFGFFVRHSLPRGQGVQSTEEVEVVIPFAFSVFLWFMLDFVGWDLVTPDLSLAAVVFVAAGVCCIVSETGSTLKHSVVLGCILGIGYYMKAAMLPIGIVLLAILFLTGRRSGWDRRQVFVSAVVFLLAAAPLAMMISSKTGKLAFGESGPLNYAWYVDDVPEISDIRDATLYGRLEHPPRILIEKPLTLEFATPINGTYPLWSDPSYWYAGVTTPFQLRKQVNAIGKTFQEYNGYLFRTIAFGAGAFVLWFFSLQKRPTTIAITAISWQWVGPSQHFPSMPWFTSRSVSSPHFSFSFGWRYIVH